MSTITVNFAERQGKVKLMHSVNNGPTGSKVRASMSNFQEFRDAQIPYARNHDASFYSGYGAEHTVDVHHIFRNFDADVNDPASYDFERTDIYLQDIESVGTKCFYRLGSRIEHGKKEGTFPPKDNQKWAEICEHIIRHYNEGWANGFHMGIEYWEIWNEPDCRNPDGSNPCWQGTDEQFVELFVTALGHLKKCFPQLKIGGPAFCGPWREAYCKLLFDAVQAAGLKPDFYSFHCYAKDPNVFTDCGEAGYATMKQYGWEKDTELILNEWNYVRGWQGDPYIYSMKTIKGLKGSSFIAGVMCVGQQSKLDHLMYYDARPCTWNGMFDTDFKTPLKGYYPFKMFSQLYRMGNCVSSLSDDSQLYSIAAEGHGEAGILVTNYIDDDDAPAKEVQIDFSNLPMSGPVQVEYYLLDETHDMELVRSEKLNASDFSSYLNIPLYTTYLIKIHAI